MEDEESLEAVALVGDLANATEGGIEKILTNGVVTTSVVVGSILSAGDELIRVEEIRVFAGANSINNGGLKIDHYGTRNVLSGADLVKEGLERGILRGVTGHGSIRLDLQQLAEKKKAAKKN